MKQAFTKFILYNLLVSLGIVAAGALLFLFVLRDLYHPLMPVILFFTLIINLISFRLTIRKPDASSNVLQMVAKSFAIKFFSYIALTVAIILLEKEKASLFSLIIFLFILYIVFSILETRALIRFVRGNG